MELREIFLEILKDNIDGMSTEEAEYYIENDAIPSIGSVGGLIYYSETEPIARNHYDEIVGLMSDFGYGCEEIPKTLNDLTWAAFSAMLPELKDDAIKFIKEENGYIDEIYVREELFEMLSEVDGDNVDISSVFEFYADDAIIIDYGELGDLSEFNVELKAAAFDKKLFSNRDVNDIEYIIGFIDEHAQAEENLLIKKI